MSGDGNGRAVTKKDRVLGELRAMIAANEIARGDHIRQADLARRFNTSITPVREALRQLEAEGVLVATPHRGVRVANADLEAVKGVYVARRLTEPYATQRAATRVSRRDLDRAARLNAEMAEARAASRSTDLGVANREFHFIFYDRCDNPGLRNIINTLWHSFPWDVLQVLERRPQESLAEHEELLAAVGAADLDAVGAAVERHLRNGYLALAAHLGDDALQDPFDLDTD